MNDKKFSLTPLAAAIMLSSSGLSAQTVIESTVMSQSAGEQFEIAPGDIIDVIDAPAVVIDQPAVEVSNNGWVFSDQTAVDVVSGGDDAFIENTGAIAGDFNGVRFADDVEGGVVVNDIDGLITSGSRAVDIQGDDIAIVNDGIIETDGTARNGVVYTNVTADNIEIVNGFTGAIDSETGAAISAELSADGTTIDIDNAGVILGRGQESSGSAAAGDGIRLERTRVNGSLANPSTGTFDGTITNSGVIDSESTQGTTAGIRTVDNVNFQGEITNEVDGSISGAQNGLYFGNGDHAGGVANNDGVISSDSRALNIDGSGLEINNTGDIIGTGAQRNGTVYADSTAQDFELNNDGVIDAGVAGAGFSAELDEAGNDFDINNTGTIAGRGNNGAGVASAGDGIRLERTRVDGSLANLTNSGDITSEGANGTVAGVRTVNGVNFQGEINNEEGGTIAGTQNGLYFGTGDHTGGVANNAGTISPRIKYRRNWLGYQQRGNWRHTWHR